MIAVRGQRYGSAVELGPAVGQEITEIGVGGGRCIQCNGPSRIYWVWACSHGRNWWSIGIGHIQNIHGRSYARSLTIGTARDRQFEHHRGTSSVNIRGREGWLIESWIDQDDRWS